MQVTNYITAPLALTIAAIAAHHRQKWCFPSQATLCARMAQHQHVRRSRRTVNRWLAQLESTNLIRRQRRHRVEPGRGLVFRSTLYRFTRAGYRWIASLAHQLQHWIRSRVGRARQHPCDTDGTMYLSMRDYQAREAPSRGPPRASKEVALRALAEIRAALNKK